MYIDLIKKLSEEDRTKITNYILTYGINKNHFIGIDEWLQSWSHSNQRLYKFLGNSFIKEYPYEYQKDTRILREEILNELFSLPFKKSYHRFYQEKIKFWFNEGKMDREVASNFSRLSDVSNFIEDKIYFGIKYKKEGSKKTLQIPAGMKPIRAFSKVVEYFKDDFNFEKFEEFRLKHSEILNDKIVKGTICISIHPLDFMTMSDNSLNWQSCMSWKDSGCYHLGTVEMMNSNNVVCCYLKAKKVFFFGKDNHAEDLLYSWNNKKWRVLGYITKDIIMCGKAYPYQNKEMSNLFLEKFKSLAEKNLGWKYNFGPELYKDMIHVDDEYKMEKNRVWMRTKNAKKHNILFDTKGMYNDMLNARSEYYICYRNKVDHNKIICVSGKAPCLCCGNDTILQEVPSYERDYYGDYNDRFKNVNKVICEECEDNFFTCHLCNDPNPFYDFYTITLKNEDSTVKRLHICEDCFKRYAIKCPVCGRPMIVEEGSFGMVPPQKYTREYRRMIIDNMDYVYEEGSSNTSEHCFHDLFICPDCLPTLKGKFIIKECHYPFNEDYIEEVFTYVGEDRERFRYENLEFLNPKDCEKMEFVKNANLIWRQRNSIIKEFLKK